jgi:hypothetical protein
LDKAQSKKERVKESNFEFKAIPTLGIKSYSEAVDFYVNLLRFKINWESRFEPSAPVYMQVSKNGLTLHLSENKRFKNPSIVFVETKNIRKFHEMLKKNSPRLNVQDIILTDWQTLQLEIEDPFGNLLRFNENITTN